MPWGVGVIGAGPGVAALHLPTLAMMSDAVPRRPRQRPRQRPRRGARRPARCHGIAGHRRAPRGSCRGGGRDLQPARASTLARSGNASPRACGRSSARSRWRPRGKRRGRSSRRAARPVSSSSWRPTTSTTRRGIARSTISWPCSPTCARSRQRWPCRRTAATTPRSPSSPQQGAPGRGAPDLADPGMAAPMVRQLVLGLAVHDLPAVRDLAPDFEGVDFAAAVPPIGYTVGFRAGGVRVLLTAVMLPDGADPVVAAHDRHVDRPRRRGVPSVVRARGQRDRARANRRPAHDDLPTRGRRRLRARVAGAGRAPRRHGHHGVPRGPRRCDLRDRPRRRGGRRDPRREHRRDARASRSSPSSPTTIVAVAGLPQSTERGDHAAGAIVVVDGATSLVGCRGARRGGGSRRGARGGAAGGAARAVGELAEFAAQSGVPIVVHRARLRDDLVALGRSSTAPALAPRVVVAECRAPQADLPAAVRDAVGWTRALADERLVVAAGVRSDRAPARALLRARGRRACRRLDDPGAATQPRGRPCSACRRWARRPPRSRSTIPLGRSELATSTDRRGAWWPRPLRGRRTRGACVAPSRRCRGPLPSTTDLGRPAGRRRSGIRRPRSAAAFAESLVDF